MDFHGRVAIVTGAGGGLGRSHAEALSRCGAAVVVNNRTPARADAVVAAIRSEGGSAVANYDAAESPGSGGRIVDAALAAFGRVDLIVANAGRSEPAAFHKESVAHIRQVFDVNLFGAIDLVHAALPHLRSQKYGRIAVTTSSAALFGDAGFVAYAAAKAALIGFVAALAQESRPAGVVVNALAPFAHTPMTDGLFASDTFGAGAGAALGATPVTNLLLWLLGEQCTESGQVWIAGGRVFRRAFTQVSTGIVVAPADSTPEGVGARFGEIADPTGAVGYPSGAALLATIAAESLAADAG